MKNLFDHHRSSREYYFSFSFSDYYSIYVQGSSFPCVCVCWWRRNSVLVRCTLYDDRHGGCIIQGRENRAVKHSFHGRCVRLLDGRICREIPFFSNRKTEHLVEFKKRRTIIWVDEKEKGEKKRIEKEREREKEKILRLVEEDR